MGEEGEMEQWTCEGWRGWTKRDGQVRDERKGELTDERIYNYWYKNEEGIWKGFEEGWGVANPGEKPPIIITQTEANIEDVSVCRKVINIYI